MRLKAFGSISVLSIHRDLNLVFLINSAVTDFKGEDIEYCFSVGW